MQNLLEFKGEKKEGRFDFRARNLLQNETIILEISKENIRKKDQQLHREILEMIEDPMEQTYYDYPQQLMENKYWRRFSKYVSNSTHVRTGSLESTCTRSQQSHRS